MNGTKIIFALLLGVSLLVSGCDNEDDQTASSGSTVPEETIPFSVQGVWTTACHQFNTVVYPTMDYRQHELRITGNMGLMIERYYGLDASCTFMEAETQTLATFSLSNIVENGDGSGSADIDITSQNSCHVANTAARAGAYNSYNTSAGLCSITSWSQGMFQEVTGCADLYISPIDTVTYQIVHVSKSYGGDTVMVMGDTSGANDGSTPALRPTDIVSGGLDSDFYQN